MAVSTCHNKNRKWWHPSKLLYTFLESFPFAGAFFQKTAKYFWGHMKDAKMVLCRPRQLA